MTILDKLMVKASIKISKLKSATNDLGSESSFLCCGYKVNPLSSANVQRLFIDDLGLFNPRSAFTMYVMPRRLPTDHKHV